MLVGCGDRDLFKDSNFDQVSDDPISVDSKPVLFWATSTCLRDLFMFSLFHLVSDRFHIYFKSIFTWIISGCRLPVMLRFQPILDSLTWGYISHRKAIIFIQVIDWSNRHWIWYMLLFNVQVFFNVFFVF